MTKALVVLGLLFACKPRNVPVVPEAAEPSSKRSADAAQEEKQGQGFEQQIPEAKAPEAAPLPAATAGIAITPAPAHPNPAANPSPAATPSIQAAGFDCVPMFNVMHDVLCHLKADKRTDLKKVFVIYKQAWMETSFIPGSEEKEIYVRVPKDVGLDFAVAIAVGDRILVTWVAAKESAFSLVKDGDFENPQIPSTTNFITVSNSESPAWRVEKSDTSVCNSPRIAYEIQMGKRSQQMELDSSCDGKADGGLNSLVYQDLSLQADHLYLIRFQLARREEDKTISQIRVKFQDRILLDQALTENSWQSYGYVQRSTLVNARLSFEERGLENGVGALIDAVEVIDLGRGP